MAKVILVEDDFELRRDIANHLTDMGHEVVEVADGHDGMELMLQMEPDFVISDVCAPFEHDLVKVMGEEEVVHPEISTILVADSDNAHGVAEGLRDGADDYILKPVDYELLDAKINSIIRKRSNMMGMLRDRQLSNGLLASALGGAAFTGMASVLGVVCILLLYVLKSELGIDLFKDTHLSDLWPF